MKRGEGSGDDYDVVSLRGCEEVFGDAEADAWDCWLAGVSGGVMRGGGLPREAPVTMIVFDIVFGEWEG